MKELHESNRINELTSEEKVSLQTGDGFWKTASVDRLGIESVVMSDGPVGLRKEVDGETKKAVCFPSVAKLACSFDADTLREVGAAIGEQCRAENVDLLLAPGINIKRDPRCGRNFEYFSEDPYLSAELAKAYVSGVNSQGVGVCVKHFAGNSREYGRFVTDSVIDERALREIYLSAFERVVKECKPIAVMCAYNKLNGEYCSENKKLLTDVLRNEWGYGGVVISDWGAVNDRVKGLCAGLDLEMPQGRTSGVLQALENGTLDISVLNGSVTKILEMSDKFDRTRRNADFEYQHNLSARVSADCTVLAKNNCKLLPLSKQENIAVIGAYAEFPAYQGGGSSKVSSYKEESLLDALRQTGVNFTYSAGYCLDGTTNESLLETARAAAASHDKVVLVVGDGEYSEGRDSMRWSLPDGQLKLIDAVTNANSNVVVVLQTGSGVDVSWSSSAKALLIDYFGGENSGKAIADVMFGDVSPCGRLAETWYSYLPEFLNGYESDYKRALYTESIFVGYRYTSTAGVPTAFPFGYGLSYNEIVWSDVKASACDVKVGDKINVTLTVTNKGSSKDADVVQIYASNLDGRQFTAKKNLVAFKKVRLKPFESKKVTLTVKVSDLASYNVSENKFEVNGGKYTLYVAKHAEDDKNVLRINVLGDNTTADLSDAVPVYYSVDAKFNPTIEEFSKLYGGEFPSYSDKFDISSPLCEVQKSKFGKMVVKKLTKNVAEKEMKETMVMPLRTFSPHCLSYEMLDTVVDMLNGAFWNNLFKLKKQASKFKRKKRAAKK